MLRRPMLGAALGVGILAAQAGCGGSTTEGSGGSGPVPADQFVDRYINALCDSVGPCCQKAGLEYDPAGCKALAHALLDDNFDPSSQTFAYDPVAAGACIDQVAESIRNCLRFELEDLPACAQAFTGLLAAGEICMFDDECAKPPGGSSECLGSGYGEPGVCVAHSRGAAGDACAATCTDSGSRVDCSEIMGAGAVCFRSDGLVCDGTCKPLIGIGQPCEGDFCVDGAFCDGGTCAPLPGAGEPCVWACAASLYCDGTLCAPLKSDGAACTEAEQCISKWCEEQVCVRRTIANPTNCSGQP